MAHLVLAGGGHAHLTTLLNIPAFREKGHRVTLVSPTDYHYYSGMGPGMLAGLYRPEDLRFHIRKMATDRGADFIQAEALRVEADKRLLILDSGKAIKYDVLSFNIGSKVSYGPIGEGDPAIFPVKPIQNLIRLRQKALDLIRTRDLPGFVVVGGGPAGLEIAGALHQLSKEAQKPVKITLLAAGRLMERFPEKVRQKALKSFEQRGIRVEEGAALTAVKNGFAITGKGQEIEASCTVLAWGVKAQELFARSNLPTGPDGNLLVNKYLACKNHPEIFGGGDCIYFADRPLDKVGVYPVRQNQVLFENLLAAVEGQKPKPFDPGGPYLLIFNLGNKKAILVKNGKVFSGKWAFWLKSFIDRRFMKRFQVSGEISSAKT
ncbi:MAG: FAD-dependent oxidoreductase [Desulfatibacillaceae bacterium]|nr:FAD-dependent oxidoreductase [Desulfatibacillaceae bacterium]